ncbi:MAG: sortase [Herpetosiphonaceae bacterium]|nr:MAG: sortase [Herpetosiphonaceae bacterium]
MRARIIILLLFVLVHVPAKPAAADTAAGIPVFFPETGHTLAYNFRYFWSHHGGLPIFGYPLTEVFVEDGRPVQYFERARLEWHGDKALVLVGHLGRWRASGYEWHPAFAPVPAPGSAASNLDYFPETGHTLGGGFRQFWHANGGLQVFGYPLSEEFREVNPQDGKEYTVQYFERARFEWHPENPPQYQVQLGHLGRQYLEAMRPAPDWALAPAQGPEQAWDGLRPTHISIPRIGVDTEVVEGGFSLGKWDVPRHTAIHYWPVSGYPGTPGNISIAGHVGYRDIIFNHLVDAAIGDEIILSMGQAQRHYRVTDIWTVLPEDAWVMAPTPNETLTLITCVPIGVYSHRLIVRAAPIQP